MSSIGVIGMIASVAAEIYSPLLFFRECGGKSTKSKTLITGSVVGIFALQLSSSFIAGGSIVTALIYLACIFLCSLLFGIKSNMKIIYTVVLFTLATFSEFITASILLMITGVSMTEMTDSSEYLYFSGILISKLFLFALTYLLAIFLRKKSTLPTKVSFQVALLPFSSTFISFTIYVASYQNYSISLGILLMASIVLLIVANIYTVHIISSQFEIFEMRTKLSFLDKHLSSLDEYLEEMSKSEREIRHLNHDMKNILLSLSAAKSVEDIRKVIEPMVEQLNKGYLIFDTGYAILDVILRSKKEWADSEGISMEVDVSGRSDLHVNEIDVGVILATVLDNAIEAAKKVSDERGIDCSVVVSEGNIMISVENPLCENIDTANLTTTKKNTKQHGFGMQTIERLTEKHNGTFVIDSDNLMFRIVVSIPNIKL